MSLFRSGEQLLGLSGFQGSCSVSWERRQAAETDEGASSETKKRLYCPLATGQVVVTSWAKQHAGKLEVVQQKK